MRVCVYVCVCHYECTLACVCVCVHCVYLAKPYFWTVTVAAILAVLGFLSVCLSDHLSVDTVVPSDCNLFTPQCPHPVHNAIQSASPVRTLC